MAKPPAPEAPKAQRKAELASARERARIGMANGEQKYLPARDQGPQRKFARDFVDAGWHLGEAVMPAMVVVIVATFIPLNFIQYWAFVALWVFIFFVIGDMIITSIRVKRAVRDKFGASKVEKGLGWYASLRSVQLRFLRRGCQVSRHVPVRCAHRATLIARSWACLGSDVDARDER